MGIEIERKYLVNKDKWKQVVKAEGNYYRQGYLLVELNKTIRVRLTDRGGFLTIKGLAVGASRSEFEYTIPKEDAETLLNSFCNTEIIKTRYKVLYHGKLWEVDEFAGDNEGLIIAEIELSNEQEIFDLPEWIDREATGEEKYYSSNLSVKPYKDWSLEA